MGEHKKKYRDKGCKMATEYLGRQSSCFQCPFADCIKGKVSLLKKAKRNKAIIADFIAGMSRRRLAAKYKINHRTIDRILKTWRK